PLLPILALFAAAGLYAMFPAVRRRKIALLAAAALLAFPTWTSLRLVELRRAPDACQRAADWLRVHASGSDAIWLAPGLDLPLARTPEALRDDVPHTLGVLRQPWFSFQTNRGAAIAGERWSLRTIPFLEEEFAQQLR